MYLRKKKGMKITMKQSATDNMKLSDDSEDYIFDYRYHPPEDLIHIYNRKIYISEIKGVVSYFGYEFNEDTSSRQRTDFLHYLNGIGNNRIRDYQLVKSAPVDSAFNLDKLKGNKILIVDDMNTSGSTLDEIVRILGTVNNNCEIYIYTLIGSNN